MKFCSNCGAGLIQRVPPGDHRARFVCDGCNTIHYQNPKIVAGCIPVWDSQVLLCRRAIEPRYGLWTLPAGFMENDETALEAAIRETWEEATARVEVIELFTLLNIPHVNQVYLMYRSRLLDLDYRAGDETLELRLFAHSEIPWEDLAFVTVRETLQFYFADARTGVFRFHMGDIVRSRDHSGYVPRRAAPPEDGRGTAAGR